MGAASFSPLSLLVNITKPSPVRTDAAFTAAFGFVVFGSKNPGQLEAIIQNLKDTRQGDGPLQVIQSPPESAYMALT